MTLLLISVYNIYDECGNDQRRRLKESGRSKPLAMKEVREMMSRKTVTVETKDSFTVSAGYSQALSDYTCGAETAMDEWLANSAEIGRAHV